MNELKMLYNPSIQDLELNERQGNEREVVYLDDVEKIITTKDADNERVAFNRGLMWAVEYLYLRLKDTNRSSL